MLFDIQAFIIIDSNANIYCKVKLMEDSYFFIVYVDDCIVFNNQSLLIHHIKTILFHEFEMFNEGALQYTIRNAIIRNYEKK